MMYLFFIIIVSFMGGTIGASIVIICKLFWSYLLFLIITAIIGALIIIACEGGKGDPFDH